jgi:CheY-like chemotaxis protein
MYTQPLPSRDLLARPPALATVLVIDDNETARRTISAALRLFRVDVYEAPTATAGLEAIRSRDFDLVMIDLRLPDMSGLELAEALQRDGLRVKWLLMSGWLTILEAVEAMRMGAVNAVERPFDIESVVLRELRAQKVPRAAWKLAPESNRQPQSAAERWARLVARACCADHDLRTLRDWGVFVGVGYSSLTEACRLVGVRPHEARDFVRILRGLVVSSGRTRHLELMLDINDSRTLRTLLRRAGLDDDVAQIPSVRDFVQRQKFIDTRNEVLEQLLKHFEIE